MPRWAFGLHWAARRQADVARCRLIAREGERRASAADARRLAEAIAARLGIAAARVQPAYETRSIGCSRKAGFRSSSTCSTRKLFDARRARACARSRADCVPAGYVLPRCAARTTSASEARAAAARDIVPAAGRPAGRIAPAARVAAARRGLSDRDAGRSDGRGACPARQRSRAGRPEPAEDATVRTALAVDARDGRLNVFMPFVGRLGGLSRRARGGQAAAAARAAAASRGPRRRPIRVSTSSG